MAGQYESFTKLPPDLVVNDGGNVSTLYNRGLVITDISRTGKLVFHKLGDIFLRGRVAMVWHPSVFSDKEHQLYNEYAIFIVSIHYHIEPKLYSNLSDYIEFTNLKVTTKMISYMTSSIIIKTEIIDAESKEVLAWAKCKYVCVDRKTRKSTPLPKWFVDKYQHMVTPGLDLRFQIPVSPSDKQDLFSHSYRIVPSDIDFNKHTNNGVYYRLFFDVSTEAAMKYRWFNMVRNDIGEFNVKDSWAVYMRESRMFDEVEIFVWKDDTREDLIHGYISRKIDDTVLFRCSVQFDIETEPKLLVAKL